MAGELNILCFKNSLSLTFSNPDWVAWLAALSPPPYKPTILFLPLRVVKLKTILESPHSFKKGILGFFLHSTAYRAIAIFFKFFPNSRQQPKSLISSSMSKWGSPLLNLSTCACSEQEGAIFFSPRVINNNGVLYTPCFLQIIKWSSNKNQSEVKYTQQARLLFAFSSYYSQGIILLVSFSIIFCIQILVWYKMKKKIHALK